MIVIYMQRVELIWRREDIPYLGFNIRDTKRLTHTTFFYIYILVVTVVHK